MKQRLELIDKLWYGKDPFKEARNNASVDHQGWNSQHIYFERAIAEVKPKIIVEIGVWKGGSVISMARELQKRGMDAQILAIDTWLGSAEHWITPEFHQGMNYYAGYPRLFYTFLANLSDLGLEEYVIPLPIDSVNAFGILQHFVIRPDLIHIDAGHDFKSVSSDLQTWWPWLAKGGAFIGDDYAADGSIWPEVQQATDAYFADVHTLSFESATPKYYARKP